MSKQIKNPKRIVVVEDDPDILNVLSIMLSLSGYEILGFSNGKPVMENQVIVPDLYVLDKMLPDVDGADICHFLKSQQITKDIPIIMISASPKLKEASLNAGASAFIEKPLSMSFFLSTIASALEANSESKWFG